MYVYVCFLYLYVNAYVHVLYAREREGERKSERLTRVSVEG